MPVHGARWPVQLPPLGHRCPRTLLLPRGCCPQLSAQPCTPQRSLVEKPSCSCPAFSGDPPHAANTLASPTVALPAGWQLCCNQAMATEPQARSITSRGLAAHQTPVPWHRAGTSRIAPPWGVFVSVSTLGAGIETPWVRKEGQKHGIARGWQRVHVCAHADLPGVPNAPQTQVDSCQISHSAGGRAGGRAAVVGTCRVLDCLLDS